MKVSPPGGASSTHTVCLCVWFTHPLRVCLSFSLPAGGSLRCTFLLLLLLTHPETSWIRRNNLIITDRDHLSRSRWPDCCSSCPGIHWPLRSASRSVRVLLWSPCCVHDVYDVWSVSLNIHNRTSNGERRGLGSHHGDLWHDHGHGWGVRVVLILMVWSLANVCCCCCCCCCSRPRDAIRAIKKRLQTSAGKNNAIVMRTLTVCLSVYVWAAVVAVFLNV